MSGSGTTPDYNKPTDPVKLTVEAWSEVLIIGALLIMIPITLVNMRKGKILHKLILAELLLAFPDGFFCFFDPPTFGWYLSSTSACIIISWTLHNVIAWVKNKPFLNQTASTIYISTIVLAQPYWILEMYANFAYFNGVNEHLFPSTRPFEAMCRDPWWLFTTINLFWNIKFHYQFGFVEIVRVSPRFGVMLVAMCLSVIFIIVDILSVTPVLKIGGLNPFWKIAFVFKCLTDTIILDDFKTVLDKLNAHKMRKLTHPSLALENGDWLRSNSRAIGVQNRRDDDVALAVKPLEAVHVEMADEESATNTTRVHSPDVVHRDGMQGREKADASIWRHDAKHFV